MLRYNYQVHVYANCLLLLVHPARPLSLDTLVCLCCSEAAGAGQAVADGAARRQHHEQRSRQLVAIRRRDARRERTADVRRAAGASEQ